MNFGTLSPSRAPRSFGAALWLAALTACWPRRPADFVGVVKGVGQGQFGWEAHVEADAGGPSYPAGEPMIVYLGRRPRGLRTGCRVRAWFSNGLVMTSYPGQAFAEALRINNSPPQRGATIATHGLTFVAIDGATGISLCASRRRTRFQFNAPVTKALRS